MSLAPYAKPSACGVGVVDVGQDVPGSVFECCADAG